MTRVAVLAGALLLVAGLHHAAAQTYRTFTSRGGKTLEARVTSYDERTRTVTLETPAKKPVRIKVAGLSKADQKHVHAWRMRNVVASPGRFKITAERKTLSKERSDDGWAREEKKEIGYDITLTNTTTLPITDLVVRYRIFYRQEDDRGTRSESAGGIKKISEIPAARKAEFTTEGVTLARERPTGGWYSDESTRDSGIKGIWIRVYLGSDTQDPVREMAVPEKIMDTEKWSAHGSPPTGA